MNGSRNRVSPSEGQTSRIATVGSDRLTEPRRNSDDKRDTWPCKMESLFALTAYNVNLFCIWTFPAYCFKNGGAAFFIPYILTVVLCGMPLYMAELMFGQSGGGGLVELWHCAPLFKGVGYAGVFINFTAAIYYAVYAAWTVYYLAASFRSQLLWRDCDPRTRWATTACSLSSPNCTYETLWNTTLCRSNSSDFIHYQFGTSNVQLRLAIHDLVSFNDSSNSTSVLNGSRGDFEWIRTRHINDSQTSLWRLPAHDYFENEMLHVSSSISEVNSGAGMSYEVILSLLLICIIVCFGLIRGAKSVGKACVIMVSLSYAFMVIVLVRAVFAFGGAAIGLKTYLFPDWMRLTDFHVWGDAALLAFLTLFPTWGSVANIGSHNAVDSKFREDAIIVTLGSAVSNVFYGFTIAMFIGVLANAVDVSPVAFVTTGPHLLFIAVAQALSQLPVAPLWSSFLFFSILNVVLGTLLIITQTVVESVTRSCVSNQSTRQWRLLFTAAVCGAVFLIGLGLVGTQVIMQLEHYCSWWNTVILALIELTIVFFFSSRFENTSPNQTNASKYSRIVYCVITLWQLLAVVILLLILVYIFYPYTPVVLSLYPFKYITWAEVIGWILTSLPLLFILVMAVKTLVQTGGDSFVEKLRNSVKPTQEWIEKHTTDNQDVTLNKRNIPDDIEAAPIMVRRASNRSESAIMVVEQQPSNVSTVTDIPPPPPEPAPEKPMRISSTEPALKPGKINRGTQMTRDVAIQTGGEDGEGAIVEYPEHFDHPEFMGVGGSGSKRHGKRKEHRKKDKKHKKRDKHKDDDEAENLPTPPPVPTAAFLEVMPAPEAEAVDASTGGQGKRDAGQSDNEHGQ